MLSKVFKRAKKRDLILDWFKWFMNGLEIRSISQLIKYAINKNTLCFLHTIIISIHLQPFAEIMTLTDIQEGVIVRCIQQLNETLQDVKDAARIIGNPALHQKMEEASNAIKRDIVFAASLYFQD